MLGLTTVSSLLLLNMGATVSVSIAEMIKKLSLLYINTNDLRQEISNTPDADHSHFVVTTTTNKEKILTQTRRNIMYLATHGTN